MSHPLNEIVAQPLQQIAGKLAELLSSGDIAGTLGPEPARVLGARSRLGCLRLALVVDVLRAIHRLPRTSEGARQRFVAPFLIAAGRLLGESLPRFQRYAQMTREQTAEFFAAWVSETSPFGFRHAASEWMGLRLCRLAAQFTSFAPLSEVRAVLESLIRAVLELDPGEEDSAGLAALQQEIRLACREPIRPPDLMPEQEPRPPQRLTTGRLGAPTCARFDATRPRLAVGTEQGAVYLLELADAQVPFGVRLFEDPGVVDVALIPETNWLVVGSEDQKVRLFDVASGFRCWSRGTFDEIQQLLPLELATGPGVLIAVDTCGMVIPLAADEPPERRAHFRLQAYPPRRLTRAIFSPDPAQEIFAVIEQADTANGHEDIRLVDREGKRIGTLIGHRDVVGGCAFSPWGRLLASVGYDGTVRLWDTATTSQRTIWEFGPEHRFTSVAFSPDGRLLMVGSGESQGNLLRDDRPSEQKGVLILNVTNGEIVRRLSTEQPVERLALSPDGRFLALLGDEDSLLLWDLRHPTDDSRAAERIRPYRVGGRGLSESHYDPEAIAALIEAARQGDLDTVKVALADGMDVNACNLEGETALHAAASEGHLAIVEFLLDQGADSLRQDAEGRTARWLALETGEREVAALFADRGETYEDERQLLQAIRNEGIDRVRRLLEAGADPDGRENATARPPHPQTMEDETATPLTQTAFLGDEELLEVLLDAGADPERRDRVPLSPWGAAMYGGQISAAAFLVLRGASPDPGRTLLEAIRLGNAGAVDRLLQTDLDLNELVEQPEGPCTALQLAVSEGRADFAVQLLHAGADPQAPTLKEVSLLTEALACPERIWLLRELLQRGLDANERDTVGMPLLTRVAREEPRPDTFDVVALLLQSGAEVDARDSRGRTALHHLAASEPADEFVAELLLAFGADPEAKDQRDRTPVRIARKRGNDSLAEILGDRRARVIWPRRLNHPRTAEDFAVRARIRMAAGRWAEAVADYEQAIRFDPARSDPGMSDWYARRAEASDALGNGSPRQAIWHYMLAQQSPLLSVRLAHYRVAHQIDELFWWAGNNLAWDAATWPAPHLRDGTLALRFAVEIDRRSESRCWSFLDTLAAAHAAAGEYEQAVRCAERALPLAPESEQELIAHNLDRYRLGQGWEDPDREPAPIPPPPEPWLSPIEQLLRAGQYRQAIEKAREDVAAGAPTLDQQIDLGRALLAWGEISEAVQHLERAAGHLEHEADLSMRHVAVVLDLIRARVMTSDFTEAQQLLDRATALAETALAPEHPFWGEILSLRGWCLLQSDQLGRAESTLLDALGFCADCLRPPHGTTSRCLFMLGELARKQEHHDEALSRLADALEVQEGLVGSNHPALAATLALVVESLLTLGEPERALPLALHGREILSGVLGSHHPRTLVMDAQFGRTIEAANRRGSPQEETQ